MGRGVHSPRYRKPTSIFKKKLGSTQFQEGLRERVRVTEDYVKETEKYKQNHRGTIIKENTKNPPKPKKKKNPKKHNPPPPTPPPPPPKKNQPESKGIKRALQGTQRMPQEFQTCKKTLGHRTRGGGATGYLPIEDKKEERKGICQNRERLVPDSDET